jgi:hypothetical protein
LGCHLEPVHAPGVLTIDEGTDGLSQGLWLAPACLTCSSITESSMALGGVPFSNDMGKWALEAVGLSTNTEYRHHDTLGNWEFEECFGQVSICTPVPEIACQALVRFLDISMG